MKRIRLLVAIILVAGGVFILAGGWSYTSNRGELKLGEFKASVAEKRTVPPWVGGVAVIAGALVLVAGRWGRGAAS